MKSVWVAYLPVRHSWVNWIFDCYHFCFPHLRLEIPQSRHHSVPHSFVMHVNALFEYLNLYIGPMKYYEIIIWYLRQTALFEASIIPSYLRFSPKQSSSELKTTCWSISPLKEIWVSPQPFWLSFRFRMITITMTVTMTRKATIAASIPTTKYYHFIRMLN